MRRQFYTEKFFSTRSKVKVKSKAKSWVSFRFRCAKTFFIQFFESVGKKTMRNKMWKLVKIAQVSREREYKKHCNEKFLGFIFLFHRIFSIFRNVLTRRGFFSDFFSLCWINPAYHKFLNLCFCLFVNSFSVCFSYFSFLSVSNCQKIFFLMNKSSNKSPKKWSKN